jgi:signal transduction histidine kinase
MNRVLIVDDNRDNMYLLHVLLEGNGFVVEEAGDGAEALVKAGQFTPTIIISDLLMPVMDGYSLLKHCKADERLKLIPFVVYTATYTDPKDERLALSLGAEAFIVKPAEPETFITRIREVLAMQRRGELPLNTLTEADETVLLKQYSEVLIRKLEDKVVQLEEANRALREEYTERRRLEEQLRQAQKMEAISRLAGGVAHDFNNLLTIITGFCEEILAHLPAGHEARTSVKEILKAVDRSAALTGQLLAFSRRQVVALKVLDLNGVIRGVERMLQRVIGEDVKLETSLAENLGAVRADAGQLEQVLMNLAVNARDAMPRGGKLTVETNNIDLDEVYARLHEPAKSGPHVLLAVSDTGCGMTAEVKARIFEPFFTTKGPGKGTGLGLATIQGIVSQLGGHIVAYSEENIGTSFKIYLPRLADSVRPDGGETSLQPVRGGTESILLVEDDALLRNLLRNTLRDAGYSVTAAGDGNEALRLAARQRGPLDIIVTDVIMPGMGGRQMVEQLVTTFPKVKVLYLSGYTDDAVIRHGILHDQVPFLQKPFTSAALQRKVREVLDS